MKSEYEIREYLKSELYTYRCNVTYGKDNRDTKQSIITILYFLELDWNITDGQIWNITDDQILKLAKDIEG